MNQVNFALIPLVCCLAACSSNNQAAAPLSADSATRGSARTSSQSAGSARDGFGRDASTSTQRESSSNQLIYEKSSGGQIKSGASKYDSAATRDTDGSQSSGKSSSAARVIGAWSGNDGQQRITVKFGANGSLLINNAAGANPGNWSPASGGRFRIQVGAYSGEFVLVDSNTGSLTLGDSSVELRR